MDKCAVCCVEYWLRILLSNRNHLLQILPMNTLTARAFFGFLLPLLFLLPSNLWANMANPVQEGDVIGEPSGMLDSITVLYEYLWIDMTPIGAGERYGRVSVDYTIVNNGTERTIPLVFLPGAMEVRYPNSGGSNHPDTTFMIEVALDDNPVSISGTLANVDSLPTEWRIPSTTPGLNGSDPVRYEAQNEGMIQFMLRIPSGQHVVRVRYRAAPTSNSSKRITKLWQFAYILAPARQWAGFGTLETVVTVPDGWEVAVTPAMTLSENFWWKGKWEGIPSDAITISFAMPTPGWLSYLDNGLPIIASLLGIALCWSIGKRVGKWLVRTKRTPGWSVPMALLAGAGWALLVLMAMLLASSIVSNTLGHQLARGYGYGSAIALVLIYMPGTFLVGTLLTVIAAYRGTKQMKGTIQ